MRLAYFHVEGFRSLGNVTLDFEKANATRMAVIRGENGSGKTNILRAIEAWVELLGIQNLSKWVSLERIGGEDFSHQFPSGIRLAGRLVDVDKYLSLRRLPNPSGIKTVEAEFRIQRVNGEAQAVIIKLAVNQTAFVGAADASAGPLELDEYEAIHAGWKAFVDTTFRVGALARITAKRVLVGGSAGLGQFLLAKQNSDADEERDAFDGFRDFLMKPPLSRGRISISGSMEDEVRVWEKAELGEGRKDIRLESMGSSTPEIVSVLAYTILSGRSVVMVEEPESHLHYKTQQKLKEVLEKLANDDSVMPLQLIIESHSHEFAAGTHYFDVQRDPATGLTTVEAKPNAEAYKHYNEPGPVKEALEHLLTRVLETDEIVAFADGTSVTAKQMKEWLATNDPRAKAFIDEVSRDILLAVANTADLKNDRSKAGG